MKKKPLIDGLPVDFVERVRDQFPDQAQLIFGHCFQRPPVIRTNTELISVEDLRRQFSILGFESTPVPLLPSAFWVESADRRTLTDTKLYQAGLFYIQSIASQLIVKALDPQPGEKIIDLCAAPGSKTTQIALAMKKEGELIANDNSRSRMFRLMANLKHQFLKDFVEVKNYSGQNYPKFYPEAFDRVLVDAPCSSESRFDRRHPKSINFWSRHKVKSFAKLQKRLLSAGIQCCKPGGLIVYSTCTFSPEENELVLERILKKHPEVEMEPIDWEVERLPILKKWAKKELSPEIQQALRLQPNDHQEGFFLCRLRKTSSSALETV